MARKNTKKTKLPIDAPSQENASIENAKKTFDTPSGTQSLSDGLWGIVNNKTRYGTVTQFSGLEFVRYEYRRIPEQFREEAFKSDFLDVIEVTGGLREEQPDLPENEVAFVEDVVSSNNQETDATAGLEEG